MPTEAELRDLLHGDDPDRGALDTARIIRRAKTRRRPKQLASGLAGGVAAVGAIAFTVPALLGLGGGLSMASGGSAADEAAAGDDTSVLKDGAAPESATMSAAAAETLNACGAPVAEIAPDSDGLVLTVAPVDAAAGEEWIDATVTLANEGVVPVEGTTAATPALTLADDGTVLWHSNGATVQMVVVVDLAPGEAMSYPATFQPVLCSPEDDASGAAFPPGLPAVDPGAYQLSAAIDLLPADGSPARVITGPATAITLR